MIEDIVYQVQSQLIRSVEQQLIGARAGHRIFDLLNEVEAGGDLRRRKRGPPNRERAKAVGTSP